MFGTTLSSESRILLIARRCCTGYITEPLRQRQSQRDAARIFGFISLPPHDDQRTATVTVGANAVQFNKEATRWLGICLASQLLLKQHHAIRMKEGRKAMTSLRRLTGRWALAGQMQETHDGLFQSVIRFGSQLWWKGDHVTGTIDRAEELRLLVNQEARRQWADSGRPI